MLKDSQVPADLALRAYKWMDTALDYQKSRLGCWRAGWNIREHEVWLCWHTVRCASVLLPGFRKI